MDRAGPGSGSHTMTSFFPEKPTRLTTVLHSALGFQRLKDRKNRHETAQKTQKTTISRAVGTSTRAVACFQQASHSHTPSFVDTFTRAVANKFTNYKSHGSSFRWTCDRAWNKKENTTPQRVEDSLWLLPRCSSTLQAKSGL